MPAPDNAISDDRTLSILHKNNKYYLKIIAPARLFILCISCDMSNLRATAVHATPARHYFSQKIAEWKHRHPPGRADEIEWAASLRSRRLHYPAPLLFKKSKPLSPDFAGVTSIVRIALHQSAEPGRHRNRIIRGRASFHPPSRRRMNSRSRTRPTGNSYSPIFSKP